MELDITKARIAIETIAQREGRSVEYIYNEINKAIEAGYANPDMRKNWDERFGEGVNPTPEEFICVLSKEIE